MPFIALHLFHPFSCITLLFFSSAVHLPFVPTSTVDLHPHLIAIVDSSLASKRMRVARFSLLRSSFALFLHSLAASHVPLITPQPAPSPALSLPPASQPPAPSPIPPSPASAPPDSHPHTRMAGALSLLQRWLQDDNREVQVS